MQGDVCAQFRVSGVMGSCGGPKIIERRKAQDAELKRYLLLEREIRMGAISASECFVSH